MFIVLTLEDSGRKIHINADCIVGLEERKYTTGGTSYTVLYTTAVQSSKDSAFLVKESPAEIHQAIADAEKAADWGDKPL